MLFAVLPLSAWAAAQDSYGTWVAYNGSLKVSVGPAGVTGTCDPGAHLACSVTGGSVTSTGFNFTVINTIDPGLSNTMVVSLTVQGDLASGQETTTWSTGYSYTDPFNMTRIGWPLACTLSANPASIAPGGSSTLTASCSPAATTYTWSGTCAGTSGATCLVSPSGTTTYSVTGSNATGSGTAQATVTPFNVQVTVVDNTVKAVVGYNSADTNRIGNVFVFGRLPADSALFGSANKSAPADGNTERAGTLVPAVLTASGWQQVLGSGSLAPVYSGALNSSTSSFALYVSGLFDQSRDAGVMCLSYTTSGNASFTDQGLPVVVGTDPSVTCPSVTLANNPQTGVWWNTDEGGRGFVIEARGASLFFGAFLYDPSGRSTWYAAGGGMIGNSFNAILTAYANGQTLTGPYVAPVVIGSPGNISITFTDTSHGTLTWPGGTIPIRRFDVVTGGAAMTPPAGTPETGIWWNPAESGRGFALEIQDGTMFLGGYMYDASGSPIWYLSGQAPMTDAMTYIGTWSQLGNGQTITGTYRPPTTVNSNVGSVTIRFSDTQNGTLTLPDGRTISITRFRF